MRVCGGVRGMCLCVCLCACARGTGVCGARYWGGAAPPPSRCGSARPRAIGVRGLGAPPQPSGRCKMVPGGSLPRYVRLRGPGAARSAPPPPRGCPRAAEHLAAAAGTAGASSGQQPRGAGRAAGGDQPFYAARCCGFHLSIPPSLHLAPRTQRSWAAALAARSASPGARRPRGSPGGAVPGSALGSAGPGRTRTAARGAHAGRGSAAVAAPREEPRAGGESRSGARFCLLPLGPAVLGPWDPAERRGRPGEAAPRRAARRGWHCPCRVRAGSRVPRALRRARLCPAALPAARARSQRTGAPCSERGAWSVPCRPLPPGAALPPGILPTLLGKRRKGH